MLRVIVRGVKSLDDVKAAAAAGADAVAFVTESKSDPANVDIAEVTEVARGTPPLLSVLVDTVTDEEKRMRRAIGSAHPHAVLMSAELDPMILADLQMGFPEVKWFARLSPTAYEPFHDGADGLVFPAAESEAAAKVREVTRSHVIVEGVTEADVETVVTEVQPYAIVIAAAPRDALARLIRKARDIGAQASG